MDDWRIGDIWVSKILEMCEPLPTPSEWFLDCTDEALEPHLHWLTPGQGFRNNLQSSLGKTD